MVTCGHVLCARCTENVCQYGCPKCGQVRNILLKQSMMSFIYIHMSIFLHIIQDVFQKLELKF